MLLAKGSYCLKNQVLLIQGFLGVLLPLLCLPACLDEERCNRKIESIERGLICLDFSQRVPLETGEQAALVDRMKHYKVPGLSIALIENNTIEWTRTYGYLNRDQNTPVEKNTVFQAGSVSKFVSAVMVLHFVEAGLLDLDEDVNNHLSSWKVPENEFTKERKVTLRSLLSHQSGFPSTNFDRVKAAPLPTLKQILRADYPAINEPAVPRFIPGTMWSYSNIGYVVIQLMLEDVLGTPFGQISEEVIFRPLGMTSSTFDYPLDSQLMQRQAVPHGTDGRARPPEQDTRARAQGGLYTTPADLALLLIDVMKAYQHDGGSILTQKMVKWMLRAETQVPTEALGIPLEMGLGVFMDRSTSALSFLHPGHSSPGTVCIIIAFPDAGQGVVIANNGNVGDRLYLEIVSAVAKEYRWPSGRYFRRQKGTLIPRGVKGIRREQEKLTSLTDSKKTGFEKGKNCASQLRFPEPARPF